MLLTGIAFLSFVVLGLRAGFLGVTWPSMRVTFGVPLDAVATLMFAGMFSYLVVSFNSGWLIARLGLGLYLMFAGLISAIGFAGHVFAPSWWMFVLFGVVAAVGTSALDAGLNTYFALHRSARVMNWMHACFGLGGTLSPIVITAMMERGYTWRWGYVPFVGAYVLLALCFALTARRWTSAGEASERPEAAPTGTAAAGATEAADAIELKHGLDTLKLPIVWLNLVLFFTFTGMEGVAGQWPYTLFTEGRAIDPVVAGFWTSLFWLSVTVGRIFFGFAVKFIGTVSLIRLTMGSAILSAGLIWWNPSAGLSFIGLTILGFTLAPLFPVLTSGTSERIGADHASNALGFQMAFARLGLASVPALCGVLADAWHVSVIAPFMVAVAVAMFVMHELTVLAAVQTST
jgi:fucose permease